MNAFGDLVQGPPPYCVAEFAGGGVKAVVARQSEMMALSCGTGGSGRPQRSFTLGQRIVPTCTKTRQEPASQRRHLTALEGETYGLELRATMGTS
jgi:hypothetical protein